MLETKTGVFFIAGLGFFAFAFLSNALVPALMYRNLPEQTVEQLVQKNGNLRFQFEDLARRFPDSFTAVYGRPPLRRRATRDLAQRELPQKPCGSAGKFTSVRAAGIATASSSVPSRTKNDAGDRSPRPRSTRTSSSAP